MKWALVFCIASVLSPHVAAQTADLDRLGETLDSLYLAGSYTDGEFLSRSLLVSTKYDLPDTLRATLELKLGMFQHEIGKFADAENAYQRARAVYARTEGDRSPAVASILSRLSALYAEQGRYQDALEAARNQFGMYASYYGRGNRFTALAGLALATQFAGTGQMDSSRKLFDEYDDYILTTFGDSSKEAARLFEAKAKTLAARNEYQEAESYLMRARIASLVSLGDRHPLTARIALALARIRLMRGNADSAIALANEALATSLRTHGPAHPFTAECQIVKGSALEAAGKIKDAFDAFARGLETLRSATRENFRYTSERERLAFLDLVRDESARITSSALRSSIIYPEASRVAYDALLFQKGIVVSSLEALSRSSLNSGDTATAKLLDRLASLRTRISRQFRGKIKLTKKFYTSQDSLQAEITRIEKELVRRSATYRDLTSLLSTRWEHIAPMLAHNEAAIELTRFPYYDGERKTDTILYAALKLNARDTLRPKLILLGNASVIEDTSLIRQFYRSLEKKTGKQSDLTKLISSILWSSIASELPGVSSVIISPDGIYHQLSFAALTSDDGSLLIKRYTFQYVTSTRQLLATEEKAPQKTLALFASPDYSAPLGERIMQPASRTETLRPLPETLVEADVITKEFTARDWQVERHLKQQATEAELRRLRSPGILHIATHARFEAPGMKSSTLDRSGSLFFPLTSSVLYLAGANTASRDPANDGVVTALEASDLSLQRTKLVTISACESGRGVIQPGEGVFGLSRSLMIAGARNVLLSLWQVPDRETRELMGNFYKHFLNGETMANALRAAQLVERDIVKHRYKEDIPLYWAGFVLMSN